MDRLQLSGIRKIFELAARLKDPVNMSLGQPDFEVPIEIHDAAVRAIRGNRNGYTVTEGIPELSARPAGKLRRRAQFTLGEVLLTYGAAEALCLCNGGLVQADGL